MKKNGFSCPLHWQQILTWVVFSLNILFFYIFTENLIISEDRQTIFLIFGLFALLVFLLGFMATYKDPSDKILKQEIKKREKLEKEQGQYVLEISKKYDFCVICCSNIDSSSKHCKVCNRCVDNFDHHCNWLNNCIGDQNYCYFFTLLITVFFYSSYNTVIMILAFANYTSRNDDEMKNFSDLSSKFGVSPLACAIISLIMASLNLIIIVNISYLIIIHTWLRCQGLTTYEYIIKYLSNDEPIDKKNSNDFSENVVLKINQNSKNFNTLTTKKKGRNKVLPDDLIEKIKNIGHHKIDLMDNPDKIIINEKDYNNKIFKPIVDDIYCSQIKKDKYVESHLTSMTKNYALNYITEAGPSDLNSKKLRVSNTATGNIGSNLNNVSGASNHIPSGDLMHTLYDGKG
jgi:palmitoyltransferase ZDHHC1/11